MWESIGPSAHDSGVQATRCLAEPPVRPCDAVAEPSRCNSVSLCGQPRPSRRSVDASLWTSISLALATPAPPPRRASRRSQLRAPARTASCQATPGSPSARSPPAAPRRSASPAAPLRRPRGRTMEAATGTETRERNPGGPPGPARVVTLFQVGSFQAGGAGMPIATGINGARLAGSPHRGTQRKRPDRKSSPRARTRR